jgi:predicted DsbA family dithiol-disulfide isomerase
MTPAIDYFGDPLNPQGWVMEPIRRQVAVAFPDLPWRVRPAGMVESWDRYDGPELPGGRTSVPATCARLSEQYGMPIDEYLWFDDPPTTSWPACRAISAAGLQSDTLGARALRACREATFARRRSVSDPDALREVLATIPEMDLDALDAALDDGRADDAFTEHRQAAAETDEAGVERTATRVALPTLVARGDDGIRGVSGLADAGTWLDAVAAATDREPVDEPPSVEVLLERFSPSGWVAAAELATIRDCSEATAVAAARTLVEDGRAIEETFAASPFFRLADVAQG